jgi:hypothetical protein
MSEVPNQPEAEQTTGTPAVATATAQVLLQTGKLVKEYKHRRVVNGVSIQVGAGRDRRIARTERRWKNHDLQHGRRRGAS